MKLRVRVCALSITTLGIAACGPINERNEDVTEVQSALNQTFAQHQTACQADPRVQSGVVSLTECIGADIFFKENFNGNGRTCGTCHRVERNFTIDATFIARLPSSEPAVHRREPRRIRSRSTSSKSPPRCGRGA